MSGLTLEAGSTETSGDVFSRCTRLYEVQVTVFNVASRGKAVSRTHRIYNLGVCLSAVEINGRCACSTWQLHPKRRT